jgi:hypothetical protein
LVKNSILSDNENVYNNPNIVQYLEFTSEEHTLQFYIKKGVSPKGRATPYLVNGTLSSSEEFPSHSFFFELMEIVHRNCYENEKKTKKLETLYSEPDFTINLNVSKKIYNNLFNAKTFFYKNGKWSFQY